MPYFILTAILISPNMPSLMKIAIRIYRSCILAIHCDLQQFTAITPYIQEWILSQDHIWVSPSLRTWPDLEKNSNYLLFSENYVKIEIFLKVSGRGTFCVYIYYVLFHSCFSLVTHVVEKAVDICKAIQVLPL